MTTIPVIERVRALIALAVNTQYVGEAQNAALAAVRLMYEHELVPTGHDAGRTAQPPPPPPPPPSSPPPANSRNRPEDAREQPFVEFGRWIRTQYTGRCRGCGAPVNVGDRVWWVPGKGVFCEDCEEYDRSDAI